MPNDISN